jgi:hypothetical protein
MGMAQGTQLPAVISLRCGGLNPITGPVPTNVSLVNLLPFYLPYFNNGPVFGLPGTVVGTSRSHSVDRRLGRVRTKLARRGYFFDLYSTAPRTASVQTGSAFVKHQHQLM